METLRIKVALLQQDIFLEQVGVPSDITNVSFFFFSSSHLINILTKSCFVLQALSNILLPQLSSVVAGRGCPDISVLRDVYSLLGEGGERYPAIVLDLEA